MSTTKLTKAEAMRKTIKRSREDAIAELSAEDREVYDKIVLGDSDAIRLANRASLGTPLYDSSNYVLADYHDLIEVVRRLDEPEDVSAQQGGAGPLVVGVAPGAAGANGAGTVLSGPGAGSAFPGLPGLGGGFPGLPGMGGAVLPAGSAAPAGAPVVGASQSTYEDVKELLDAWQHRYSTFSGTFEQDIISKSINSRNKELVVDLIDRGVFRVDSVQEVKFKKEGTTYVGKRGQQEFDVKKVPMYEYLLNSKVTALYEIVTEHPVGKDMFLKAAYDSQYMAIQFAFDTSNKILLEGLLDTNVDISNLRDAAHNTPMMCDFIYRVQEGDEDQLRLLVERGASLTDTDQLLSTTLMVSARVGNLKAMEFLLKYDMHDVYAKNIHGETVLSLAEAGPEKRRQDQEGYDEAVANAKERYEESKQAWEVQARAAEAAGKKPPAEPKEPQFKPRPEDYPVELVALVQDVWMMGDPTKSKQAQLIENNKKPDEFAMNFDAAF